MLARRIIACLDIDRGRVVKGVRFEQLRDAGDPVEQARCYDAWGADELVFLDISATHEGRQTTLETVRRVADMRALLLAGADKVSINSAAVREPQLLTAGAARFGSQCMVLAIDARRVPQAQPLRWEVVVNGGRVATGRDACAWAVQGVAAGAGEILLTSMDADGTRAGFDLELTRAIVAAVPVPVIASGGAGSPQHFCEVLKDAGAAAALGASVFHDRQLTIADVKQALQSAGLPVRSQVNES